MTLRIIREEECISKYYCFIYVVMEIVSVSGDMQITA